MTFFDRMTLGNLKRKYNKADNVFVRFDIPRELVKDLRIENPRQFYVFLIDKQGRVRWKAVGNPHEAEVDFLAYFLLELDKTS